MAGALVSALACGPSGEDQTAGQQINDVLSADASVAIVVPESLPEGYEFAGYDGFSSNDEPAVSIWLYSPDREGLPVVEVCVLRPGQRRGDCVTPDEDPDIVRRLGDLRVFVEGIDAEVPDDLVAEHWGDVDFTRDWASVPWVRRDR